MIETVGVGFTNVACAYVYNQAHPITRAQITLTTYGSVETEGPIPVRVRLQGQNPSDPTPRGNFSALDATQIDWGEGTPNLIPIRYSTQTFDLSTDNVRALEDITDIRIEFVDDSWASRFLCVTQVTLTIDNDGPNHNRVTYTAGLLDCAASKSFIDIPFRTLRQSDDWNNQIASYSSITPTHFLGWPTILPLVQQKFASKMVLNGDDHLVHLEFAMGVAKTTDSQRAFVSGLIHHDIDLDISFWLALHTQFGCVWDDKVHPAGLYNEVVDVSLITEDAEATPANPLVILGLGFLDVITLNYFGILDGISDKFATSAGSLTHLGATGATYYFAFTPPGASNNVGLSAQIGYPPFAPQNPQCPPPPGN